VSSPDIQQPAPAPRLVLLADDEQLVEALAVLVAHAAVRRLAKREHAARHDAREVKPS
jgi:hypothetical protein